MSSSEQQRIAEAVDREVAHYVTARREYEAAEQQAKVLKKRFDEAKEQLWDFLESAGLKTVTHEVGRLTRQSRVQAVVKDHDELNDYLDMQGLRQAFTKTVYRNQELNALTREAIEEGENIPGIEPLVVRQVTFTPKKG